MNGFSAIAFRLEGNVWWVLSTPGCHGALNPDDAAFPEIRSGLKGHPATGGGLPAISWDETRVGGPVLRLLETQRYEWDVVGSSEVTVSSSLAMLPDRQWSMRRVQTLTGTFAVVNHLGMADFRLSVQGREYPFALEIVSKKLDYDKEYRRITEDIADFCQQLLLSWDAPTGLKFTVDPTRTARIRLEQFLFLRSHLPPERLEEILESIQRRPHSKLMSESHWGPMARAGSQDWIRQPATRARDWKNVGAHFLPAQVLEIRKEDSTDTAPNRFLKFALLQFRDLCREVVEQHASALTLAREAEELGEALDAALARPFLRQLGSLTRLPLDNPTLQKRDGYREILKAWLLIQAASALAWERDEETYQGPTRNVATLYEYWIFLQLHQILDEIPGVSRDSQNPRPSEDAEPFLQIKNGELVMQLKRGEKTCAPFTVQLEGMLLRVHLYYERTFQWEQGATDASSYSRQFKPDYTLAIFPARYQGETAAATDGKVAYLHFDAKYRAENIRMIFGDLKENLDAEKQEGKATATYKRGDLLKMHTYNDAVRQTAGSYVLYPGSDIETRMDKFHEIVPGVGAFVLKPGQEECRTALKNFLRDVFVHQANQFTQYRHFSDVLHAIVREDPITFGEKKTYRPGATCVLVYLKKEVRELSREKRLVYCRALREDDARSPIRIKLGNLSGAVLCPYEGAQTAEKTSLPWLASIRSCEMLSRDELSRILLAEHWPKECLPGSASAYLLFRLDEPSNQPRRRLGSLTPKGSFQAISKTLGDLIEMPPV